ncbi:MAG: tRNA (adenosine(37)-N6)-dimethylallyltransferase MiaA [Lentisphaeria bacterium]|nr:tRNA (adenosine(37)-N6)-dimethylallyltransferase MiaA [Candidatus Neomarinimicrobiota bacterium]MCF7842800.1 tRNA (adenosine(37)-N6)-dimethylallyltransferase MiaA [Lentisphaeria bacterium]
MRLTIAGQTIDIPPGVYLILAGPTAVGKTAVAEEIAEQRAVEIISADSRQVYRGMDIGTATPSRELLVRIPHHFINELSPDMVWSAGAFYREARKRIRHILEHGKLPLVVGGTGLYLDALRNGLFKEPPRKAVIREKYEAELERIGTESLWRRLNDIDPAYAALFHHHDTKKLVRAFEIFELTGMPPTQAFAKSQDPFEVGSLMVILNRPRAELYERINLRVQQMVSAGLVKECQDLLSAGYEPTLYPLKTIGYQETFAYLDGTISEAEMIASIQQATRNFAKRQLTWFRNHPYDCWIDLED